MKSKIGIVDLFAGIGGVALGFEEQGAFQTVAMVDIDKSAYETFKFNYPDAPYFNIPIEDFSGRKVKKLIDNNYFGIVGCPPCQGFSAAGKRDPNDTRNKLANHFFRIVYESKPHFMVLENVPEILNSKEFMRHLFHLQTVKRYRIWYGVLNSALYGVPQTRQRAIVIAFHASLGIVPTAPEPTHCGNRQIFDYSSERLVRVNSENGLRVLGVYPQTKNLMTNKVAKIDWIEKSLDIYSHLQPIMTLADAIGDLPEPTLIDEKENVNAHVARLHEKNLLKKIQKVTEGGRYKTPHKEYYSQAYGRLHRYGLARTITRFFPNPGSGRFIHYEHDRSITPREAARLQGISDTFSFIKNPTITSSLIGNAFPKGLAEAIAGHVYKLIG